MGLLHVSLYRYRKEGNVPGPTESQEYWLKSVLSQSQACVLCLPHRSQTVRVLREISVACVTWIGKNKLSYPWEKYENPTESRQQLDMKDILCHLRIFYPIEILHRKVAEHQVELPWLESKETCRNNWMKMWALSCSCSCAFAPSSWTQALWNHKPN